MTNSCRLYRDRFLSPDTIEEKNIALIELLKKEKIIEATVMYDSIQCYNAHNAEVHFSFALFYAKNGNLNKAEEYLTLAHDIDPSCLEEAKQAGLVNNALSKMLDVIIKDELSRQWNVIEFNQIEPILSPGGVELFFEPKYKEEIMSIYWTLNERVQNYFYWHSATIEEEFISEPKKSYFQIRSNADRTYVHYVQVFLAFKKMSSYLRDVRFLMQTENACYVDEIIINKGRFYSYRHFTEGFWSYNKLAVIVNLSEKTPNDKLLKKFISTEYLLLAEYEIDDMLIDNENRDFHELYALYINKAFEYEPNSPEAYYQRGRFYLALENSAQAKANFKKTLAINPKHFFALFAQGVLEFKKNNFQEAIGFLTRVIDINPDYVDLFFYRGKAHEELNNRKQAVIDYQRDIERMPVHLGSSILFSGYKLYDKKHYESGLLYFHAVLDKNRVYSEELVEGEQTSIISSSSFYKNLKDKIYNQNLKANEFIGLCYSWLNEFDKALEYYEKVIQMDPKNYVVLANMGSNLVNLKRYEESWFYLNKSIVINPNYYFSHYCKACIYILTGKYTQGIEMIKKVLELDPQQKKTLQNEPDFKSINNDKEFKKLFR